jgi:hypothetical protein
LNGSGAVYSFTTGVVYESHYLNNKLHGEGIQFEKNGSKAYGTFANNNLHGYFVRQSVSGNKYRELWDNNQMVSREKIIPFHT